MTEYIEKSEVNGLVQIGWSGDAIVTVIINNGVSSFPAIPIPKGATNGDIFMPMFPDLKIEDNIGSIFMHDDNGIALIIDKKWLNAPYKKEVEE